MRIYKERYVVVSTTGTSATSEEDQLEIDTFTHRAHLPKMDPHRCLADNWPMKYSFFEDCLTSKDWASIRSDK